MAKVHPDISGAIRAFIEDQHIFFVATAPLSEQGHVNLSPKGVDCFRILSPQRVAYLDLVGSGNETSAHLLENGRITLMFCAFDGNPQILRLFGSGRSILPGQPEWQEMSAHFPTYPNMRQIFVVEIDRVQTSCGFGVPLYEYQGERSLMFDWAEKKGEEGLMRYQQENNRTSIDGLPTALGSAS